MIWVVFAIMTGLAVLSVLWPLSRPARGPSRRATEIAFYEAQLVEIDRDVARGLTSVADAEGARAQAGRHLLAAAHANAGASTSSDRNRRIAAAIAILAIPGVALGLYLRLGSPEFPDQPLSARLNAPPDQMDVGIAVARIEQHLAQDPSDGRGWELLGPVYMRLGRPDDAARAFANAIHAAGDSVELEQDLGQALVMANNGQIDDRARAAFQAALRLDPKAPAPQFYLGLAAEQVGDQARAVALWTKLLADAPPDAPWAPMVRAHMAALGAAAPAQAGGPPGPPGAAAAIAAMAPDQQAATIRSMVAQLADRLAQKGGGVDQWTQLVRAYSVLHEPDKARAALADARHSLANDQGALAQLSALARQLGLES
jgi:cytochrome c-type biogenesis protein CcmH